MIKMTHAMLFSALLPQLEMESRQSLDWGEKFLDTGSRRQHVDREVVLQVHGNPGRQIGWMSRYGCRLDLPLRGSGRARCAESGEAYVLRDGVCALEGEA